MSVKQPEEQPYGEKRAKYLNEIAETCRGLAEITEHARGGISAAGAGRRSLDRDRLVLGRLGFFRKQTKKIGYLWLDAHGDMNTPESSPSGNVHGMPLAALIGYGAPELVDLLGYQPKVEPRNVAHGRRARSGSEGAAAGEGVRRARLHHARHRRARHARRDERGAALCADDTDGVAVSLDMDFVDPADAPGVGTPVRGGVTYREAHLAMEMIADSEAMVSLEIVEINPVIDVHNKTALLGVEMMLSALGKKIL